MPIPHLRLSDGSILINLSAGPATIKPTTINYATINRLLQTSSDESDIIASLDVPTPDGIFYAYSYENVLLIHHITNDYTITTTIASINNTTCSLPKSATLLGTYASRSSLLADYPEYFI